MLQVGIHELSVYIPKHKISIWDLPIDEEEKAKASQRNGMEFNFVSQKETATEMALMAALDTLKKAKVAPDAIDVIIFISGGEKDYCSWSASALVQNRLGAVKAIAYDVYQGCNSTIMAIMLALNHFKSDAAIEYILVVGADRFSTQVENGYLSGILMGDAGEALLMKRGSELLTVLSTSCYTDGRFSEMTYALGGASSQITKDILINKKHLYQPRDFSVFGIIKDACIQNYLKVIKECLEKHHIGLEKVERIIFPNTSREVYYEILEKLAYDVDKTSLYNIGKFGHFGCVDTINNLICALDEGKLKKGDLAILTSMGVGLSWGALLLQV